MARNDLSSITSLFQALLLALALIHVSLAPFSKVEESFNVHATHDILFYLFLGKHNSKGETSLAAFDHLTFPGVVPRTFTGSFILSAALYPIAWFMDFGLVSSYATKVATYYLIRCFLALLSWRGLVSISKSLRKKYGAKYETWFIILCCSQFHMLFYMGRLLPNSFAMIICNFAFKHWIDGKRFLTILLLTFCTIVFRCDVIILLGLVGLSMLVLRQISFTRAISYGILSVMISVLITSTIDSYFWNQTLFNKPPFEDIFEFSFWGYKIVWPEFQVFWFNVIQGKSVEWGEMPLLWYFYSALPKSLLVALPLSMIAVFDINPRTGKLAIDKLSLSWFIVAFGFVIIYSVLKHKETRFLFPVLPLFNVLAAISATRIEAFSQRTSGSSMLYKLFKKLCYWGLVFTVFFSCCLSSIYLYISSHNYPGGSAIFEVNRRILYDDLSLNNKGQISVHVGVYGAMTGATNYFMLEDQDLSHLGMSISYSKDESIESISKLCSTDSPYDILLMEDSEYNKVEEKCIGSGFVVAETFSGEPFLKLGNSSILKFTKHLYVFVKNSKNTGSFRD